MELKRGTVVRTLAGHDKQRFMAVLEVADRYALIADGKTRKLSSPKRKNLIHLQLTAAVLTEQEMQSDNSLRKALKRFGAPETV